MSEKGEDRKNEGSNDMSAMLGMGGLLNGVTSLLTKLGELAEKGESLQASQSNLSDGETQSGKKVASSYGFSVKFAGSGQRDDLKVSPMQKDPSTPKTPSAPATSRVREPHIELFDEGDHLLIVAEMPGVTSEDVQLSFQGKSLTILGRSRSTEFSKTIDLPNCYEPEQVATSANNGVVEIRLRQP